MPPSPSKLQILHIFYIFSGFHMVVLILNEVQALIIRLRAVEFDSDAALRGETAAFIKAVLRRASSG